MAFWQRWFGPSRETGASGSEVERLRAQLRTAERELELFRKIKQVADLQRAFIHEQLDEESRLRALWFSTADTIDAIRHTVAESAAGQFHRRLRADQDHFGRRGLIPDRDG